MAVADYYDAVWVYGDPKIYDPAREYALSPGVVQKIAYTGYLDPTAVEVERIQEYRTPPGPYVLCTVGGGEDGAALAGVFAATRRPDGMAGVVLTGPYFPDSARRALDRASADDPGLHVMGFLSDPMELVRRASRVISMGGYNTIVEVL